METPFAIRKPARFHREVVTNDRIAVIVCSRLSVLGNPLEVFCMQVDAVCCIIAKRSRRWRKSDCTRRRIEKIFATDHFIPRGPYSQNERQVIWINKNSEIVFQAYCKLHINIAILRAWAGVDCFYIVVKAN
jgi:hypothetical protein